MGAWYTNRFDPIFHNRQDVELVRLHNNGTVARRFSIVSSVDPAGRHQHRRSGRRWQAVELIVERAAALDVGQDEVVASRPRP